ncbi:MAG: GAF domain-containing SpoIIE family protein phosphatase [Bacteroidota bacterium]
MNSSKAIIRLSALFSVLIWIVLVFTDLTILFNISNDLRPGINIQVPRILFNLFIVAIFIFYKFRIEKAESINFVDLLWKVFATGLLTTIISLVFVLFTVLLGNTRLVESVLFKDFVYLVNLAMLTTLLVSTFIIWKRLILYQKSKLLLKAWSVFEYSLLAGLIYSVIPIPELRQFSLAYLIFLILLGLFLSANLKWVAYLNFKQKLKSLLLIVLAMLYLGYFTATIYNLYSSDFEPITSIIGNIFIVALLAFVFIYAIFSFLVILFNLPTSSVFEQKLEEVVNFQRLSQSIQTEQSEEQVYTILLESSMSTVFASAGWLEINEGMDESKIYSQNISNDEIEEVKEHIKSNKIKGILDHGSDKTRGTTKYLSALKGTRFRSILAYPIKIKDRQIGILALLKDVSDGFNKEMAKIISTFANQAGISIENFRLLSQALENERYKEEVKIAKRVHNNLLPETLESNDDTELVAFSAAADEVGGDYYDTFKINDHKFAIIIGDVSGKGTSAAFHMSQMKGVFHSLSQLNLNPEEFLVKANAALSLCLDKTSFITLSYFILDSETKTIDFARAGHCPTLYYNADERNTEYFKNKGLGLGIIRSNDFCKYVEVSEIKYKPGDIMLLYTDGITEAKNRKGEEFGYRRLEETLQESAEREPKEIQKYLIDKLYDFSGTEAIDDDYTTMIVKFK